MAGPFTFGENARVRVNVADVYDAGFNSRKGYVVAELAAGSSKLILQIDPAAAVLLGEQMARHGRKAKRKARAAE
ncbi:MAG: hypothetical protein OSA97_06815 [Nevskia sp.]|nr:hypothetical protein [Nevskia sp.]